MKVEVKEIVTPPPKVVVLTCTEEEAGLIYEFARYYATVHYDGGAAARLKEKLVDFKDKGVRPHTSAFKE